MTLKEFREEVFRAFGQNLERATPATVQEFMAHMQQVLFARFGTDQPIELRAEKLRSWEDIVTDFFYRVLQSEGPDLEQALIQLWLIGFELHFADIEEQRQRQLAELTEQDDLT
jgi:hypothetical protein